MPDYKMANGTVVAPRKHVGPVPWIALMVALIINGCATTVPQSAPEPPAPVADQWSTEQRLRTEIQSWLGTPYRMGGMNRRGVDCSGLVVILYSGLFDLRLPRTTTALMQTGQGVKKNDLAAGDLVFFRPGSKIHHVGIYLGADEFVHSSTSQGVIVSRINDDFWQRCYLMGRRVL